MHRIQLKSISAMFIKAMMVLSAFELLPGIGQHTCHADIYENSDGELATCIPAKKRADPFSLPKAIEAARGYQEGLLTKEQAIKWLEDVVEDYSSSGNKESAIVRFIQDHNSMRDFKLSLATNRIGWSSDNNVYWAENELTGAKQLLVKVFDEDYNYVLQQIWGLDRLRLAEGVKAPSLQALGKFYYKGKRHFMVAETAAPGKTLLQYMYDIAALAYGNERQQAVQKLVSICHTNGNKLANFHQSKHLKMAPLSFEMEKMLYDSFDKARHVLQEDFGASINVATLGRYVTWVVEQMKSEMHLRGIMHGKVKLAHTYFDEVRNSLTLTDSRALIESFANDGNLVGLPIADVHQFARSLYFNNWGYFSIDEENIERITLLDRDEIIAAVDAFYAGYAEVTGVLPSKIEEDFLQLRYNLNIIANSSRILPKTKSTRLQDLVARSISELTYQLANFQPDYL